MRFLAFLLLAVAGCRSDSRPPSYMQDAPRSGQDAARAVEAIRTELGSEFEIEIVNDIFFLAANGGRRHFDQGASTIQRVSSFLWREYFTTRPTLPLRVFCFRNKETYDAYVRKTYQREPSTPYGFYMPAERKMIMNLGTGTGTLAHELVHPLLAEDFPMVPTWFNEGFASLFEQSSTEFDGRIIGLINWRLTRLKEAVRADRAMALQALLATSAEEFYKDETGLHYATARYLIMYLQDHDQLLPFYKAFRAAREDFSGRATLEKITGKSIEKLDEIWREWVKKL